jgi:predicted AlkP superfamily pyrophosphatase or phosphodiesterase
MLADPHDTAVRERVQALLTQLAADPASGIERILGREEIHALRGFPDASFVVAFRIGYEMAYELAPPLITAPSNLGMHGYLPEKAEMRSSFFLVGPGVAKGRNLGEIDMRQIAPTLADILKVHLAAAEMAGIPAP